MLLGTSQKIHRKGMGILPADLLFGSVDMVLSKAAGRMLAKAPHYWRSCSTGNNLLEHLQTLPLSRKMVINKIKEWAKTMNHCSKNLVWRELIWQRPFKLEDLHAVLVSLATLTPRGAVVFEARNSGGKITYLVGADRLYIDAIESVFHAHGNVQFSDASPESRCKVNFARSLKISHPALALKTDTSLTTIRAGLAAMATSKSSITLQIVLGRSYAPSYTPARITSPEAHWVEVIRGCVPEASAEQRRSIRTKAESNKFEAAMRMGISSHDPKQLNGLISALKTLESAGVRISSEQINPERLSLAKAPWSFPLRLSVTELACFLLLPAGEEEFPGTMGIHPRTILPPSWYKPPTAASQNRTFAVSMERKPTKLSISTVDGLLHTVITGPTGSGKSTVILNMIISDIYANKSVLLIDPKSELAISVLARVPESRIDDVVVIDPSSSTPCGFNPLGLKSYGSPTLIADGILAVLEQVFADSWGVRINDILSATLMTLAEIDGSTLLWVLPLLTDDVFRRKIISQIKNVGVMSFWNEYEALSPAMRQTWLAPISNKLRAFTMREGLRNILANRTPNSI